MMVVNIAALNNVMAKTLYPTINSVAFSLRVRIKLEKIHLFAYIIMCTQLLLRHLVNSTVQSYWLLVSITSSCILSNLLHHCVDVLSFLENVVCESKRRQTKSVNMLTALERGDSMITSQRLNIVDEHDTKDDHDDASYTAGNSSPMVTCNKLITPIALLLVALFI